MREEREGENETEGRKENPEEAMIEVESEWKQGEDGTQSARDRRVEIPQERRSAPVGTGEGMRHLGEHKRVMEFSNCVGTEPHLTYTSFFYKNHVYNKNVEAQICLKLKNIVVILLGISIPFPASDEI